MITNPFANLSVERDEGLKRKITILWVRAAVKLNATENAITPDEMEAEFSGVGRGLKLGNKFPIGPRGVPESIVAGG